MDYAFYIASAVGALAVYLMMPTPGGRFGKFGALLGLITLAGLFGFLFTGTTAADRPSVYYYLFSIIAIASAVRVITHPRPVYSALFFVMVVLAVAGMFIVLEAEFMAFAMIMIYAGAILVTYLFVIMLATLPQAEGEEEQSPMYDRLAREPFSATLLGFALIAVLSSILFQGEGQQPTEAFADKPRHVVAVSDLTPRVVRMLEDRQVLPAEIDLTDAQLNVLGVDQLQVVPVTGEMIQIPITEELKAELEMQVGNIDQIGLALFRGHTLGIELAGVILLLSMVGAIVIGRKRILEDDTTDPQMG